MGRTGLPGDRHAARHRRHPADAGAARAGGGRRDRDHAAGHRGGAMPARASKMFEKVSVPVLGVVENMSTHVCITAAMRRRAVRRRAAARAGGGVRRELLARLPLDARSRGGRRRPPDGRCRAGSARRRPMNDGAAGGRRACSRGPKRSVGAVSEDRRREKTAEMSIKSGSLDPPHGRAARDDRALRAGPGARGRTASRIVSYGTSSYGYDVRCAASSRSSPTSTRPSSTRRPSTRRASWT